MPLTLRIVDPTDFPTPDDGYATLFIDADTGLPSYKDDQGNILPLGTQGADGPQGDPGPPGADSASYFPGGWT